MLIDTLNKLNKEYVNNYLRLVGVGLRRLNISNTVVRKPTSYLTINFIDCKLRLRYVGYQFELTFSSDGRQLRVSAFKGSLIHDDPLDSLEQVKKAIVKSIKQKTLG